MNPLDSLTVKNLLPSLEALYPEHKIFALSSLDDKLREKLNDLYQTFGYRNLDAFLADIGYEIIPQSAVRDLRSEVLYSPGREPEPIRTKVKNMLVLLEEYYPSRVIRGSLQTDHKKLAAKISGLYQWLGYEDASAFLAAYGYQYQPVSGRPENDYQGVIEALMEKYADIPKPKNMGILIFENPEYRGQLKTLQNKANELFGMSLKAFFAEIGLFEDKGEAASSPAPKGVSAGSTMQDAALSALKQLYDGLDPAIYGSFEDAAAKLEGVTVKQNKAGKIYVFRVTRCPETLVLPYGIDMLSKGAFQRETGLKSISLPSSLTEIPEEAFAGCAGLRELHLPDGLTEIGSRAFADCTALERVSFPVSLQAVGKEAFAGCASLTEVEHPNPLLRVESNSFDGCPYRFEAFSDTESTPAELFDWVPGKKGCATITGYRGTASSIRIPSIVDGKMVTALGPCAFQGSSVLKEVSMPDTVLTLQKDVFRDCEKLEKVHLSNGLSKITTTTFSGCLSLQEINIPDSVTELRRGTFRDAPITTLHIGRQLSQLAWDCFVTGQSDPFSGAWKYLRTIQTVSVDPENRWLRAVDGCIYSFDGKTLIAALRDYRSIVIPDGVEVIGAGAFEHMHSLTDVTFPETLTQICASAFSDTGLRSIRLGKNVRVIEDGAFNFCGALSSVLFEPGIEEIGAGAFDGCPIVSVLLPATVRHLGVRSFSCFGSYNDKMLDFRIAEDNPWLRADGVALYQLEEGEKTLSVLYGKQFKAYSDEDDALSYSVEPGTTRIADEAFADCVKLTELSLPEGLVSIGSHAFKQCGVSELFLPASLREIGDAAFSGGKDWFGNRYSLSAIHVAEGNPVFYVEENALFSRLPDGNCALVTCLSQKETLTIPDNTVRIYGEAFSNQPVHEIRLPSALNEIGEGAFKGCDELRRIHLGVKDPSGKSRFAVIYLPQVVRNDFFWDTSLRDQYMDCIRSGSEGSLFNFEKYDSLFPSISEDKDKVLVAVDRLKSAVSLAPVYAENYRRYIKQNQTLAVKNVITQDDTDGLELLSQLDCIRGDKLDDYIALANRSGKTGAQVYLMNRKNTQTQFSFDHLDEEFNL